MAQYSVRESARKAKEALPVWVHSVSVECDFTCSSDYPEYGRWSQAVQPGVDNAPCSIYRGDNPDDCLADCLSDIRRRESQSGLVASDGVGEG